MKSKSLSLRGPSVSKIIWTDYIAFISVIFPVVIWIVCLAWIPDWRGDGPVIPVWMISYVLVFSVLVSLVGSLFLAWRVWLIKTIFRNGSVVSGRITSVSLKRDRGRLAYIYTFRGKVFETGVSIHRNTQTKELHSGEKIILLVDQNNPKRAFMRDLYV